MYGLIRKVLVSVAFLMISSAAFADSTTDTGPITDIYQIDVLIFEHLEPNRFKTEHWPNFVGKIDAKQAVNLNALQANAPESLDTLEVLDALDEAGEQPLNKVIKNSINLVNPKNMLLNNELRALKSNKADRLIKYIAWNQPLAPNVKSTPVYFTVGKDQEVTALISVKPGRNIFNVNLDLVYKLQAEDLRLDPGVEEIRVTRDVKVKRKELYYLDHPVIGVFIMITPLITNN
jgi:hypothetical protein